MIYNSIAGLVENAIKYDLIKADDRIYVRNQLLAKLKLYTFPSENKIDLDKTIPELLKEITTYAIENMIIDNTLDEIDIFQANLMNCFISSPSEINKKFWEYHEDYPRKATDYFYELSSRSNYIQTERLKKNIQFKTDTKYGIVEITINLSKPEKDPTQIKRELEAKRNHIEYPKCLLCIENEGYEGRIGYPARANHRIIKVPLLGENWYLQYSPYIYYNEHSILLSEEHRQMKINRETFERLLLFVDIFPHYFIGSNADLPIVGGSILSHDHYQAGKHTFAMENAKILDTYIFKKYKNIEVSILKWPLSVIRLKGKNRANLVELGEHILSLWKRYSDKEVDIIAETNNISHNTITPIARKKDGIYELDLVLRNNRVSLEHPQGVFHPHSDVQHIKRENIGLIEVMGLAVLPARLVSELEEVKNFIQGLAKEVPSHHQKWAEDMKRKYSNKDNIETFMEKELGYKFIRILEDSGVFKQDRQGLKAFKKFIEVIKI